MQQAARLVYRGLAWLFLAGAVLQFFLAGLGVFGTGASFEIHATVGITLIIVSIVLLILAVVLFSVGNLARESARLAGLLVILMLVQWVLVEAFSDAAPALAALHPVNGFLVLIVACALALGFRLPLTTERSRSRA